MSSDIADAFAGPFRTTPATDAAPVEFGPDWDWLPEATKRDFERRAKGLVTLSDSPMAWKVVLAQMLYAAQATRSLCVDGTIKERHERGSTE